MTATQDPSTKPAAKRRAGQDSDAQGVSKRPYKILRELRLDLTDPSSLVEQLRSVAKDDAPVTVFALVGVGTGVNPRAGITQLGRDNDLDGDYEVVAENAFTHLPNVKTATKRDVSIG